VLALEAGACEERELEAACEVFDDTMVKVLLWPEAGACKFWRGVHLVPRRPALSSASGSGERSRQRCTQCGVHDKTAVSMSIRLNGNRLGRVVVCSCATRVGSVGGVRLMPWSWYSYYVEGIPAARRKLPSESGSGLSGRVETSVRRKGVACGRALRSLGRGVEMGWMQNASTSWQRLSVVERRTATRGQ
jgi:hypothetical protein